MARCFAILLLIIGALTLGSVVLQFLLPLAALLAIVWLGVLVVRNRGNSQTRLGQEIAQASLDTVSKATRMTGKSIQAAARAGKTARNYLQS